MRVIYRIAKTELQLMFFSPIAWLILIIFLFQSGIILTDNIKHWLQHQESYGNFLAAAYGGLTHIIFSFEWLDAFFPVIQSTLFLYIPLLTMGLISREVNSGSIKLLLSSPVKVSQIVFGKYLAMLGYCFLFICIILLFMVTGSVFIRNMDFPVTLSALLGTYLLISTYSAIGLFMSSLTSYQIVAAISTLISLAALKYIGQIGQNIEWIRIITHFLSFASRVSPNMNNGLISSADVFYFIILISLFLALTIMRLNDGRQVRPVWMKWIRYVILITIFLGFTFFTSRPQFIKYVDVTANKGQTVSKNTQNIIKKIRRPLKVTAYTNLLDEHAHIGLPNQRSNDNLFWEPYTRFMPSMIFQYVYYYDTSKSWIFRSKDNANYTISQLAEKFSDSYGYSMDMFLTPLEMRKQIDLEKEEHRFVRVLEANSQKSYLRVFDDPAEAPFEHEIAASLGRLVGSQPKILFVTGNFERSIYKGDPTQFQNATGMPGVRYALINQGFDIDTISLKYQDIPPGISTLVIADPRQNLSDSDFRKIERYLNNGGNMVILCDAGRQAVINPLLKLMGVRLMDGVIVQPSKYFGPEHIEGKISDGIDSFFNKNKLINHYNMDSLNPVIMNGASGLAYTDSGYYKISPIVFSEAGSAWNKKGSFSMDTSEMTFNIKNGDSRDRIPLALTLSRKLKSNEQRIVIVGDADFMNNDNVLNSGNAAFVTEMFKWLNFGAFPIDTDPGKTIDNDFSAKRKDLVPTKIVYFGVLPAFLVLLSSVLLLRRKRV